MRSIALGKGLLLSASLLCLHKPASAQDHHENDEHPVSIIPPQQAELMTVMAGLKAGTLDLRDIGPATGPASVFPELEFSSAFDVAHPALANTAWEQHMPSLKDAREAGRTSTEIFRQVAVTTPAGPLRLDVYVVSDAFHLDAPGLPRYEYTNTMLACYEAGSAAPAMIVRYISRRADFLAADVKWLQAPPAWKTDAHARKAATPPESDRFTLYPNPARKEVALQFLLSEAGEVSVKVYNALGQLADAPLPTAMMDAGPQSYRYDVAKLPPGAYTLTALIRGKVFTTRLTVL